MTPTANQIEKLPKWAQEHIQNLERRRFIAERALMEFLDDQQPSPFAYEQNVCLHEGPPQLIRRYIQTHRMTVTHQGVEVDILLRDHGTGIEISWSDQRGLVKEVAMVPIGPHQIKLVQKEAMR